MSIRLNINASVSRSVANIEARRATGKPRSRCTKREYKIKLNDQGHKTIILRTVRIKICETGSLKKCFKLTFETVKGST